VFTGLVEDRGVVVAAAPAGGGARLTLRTSIPVAEIAVGDSVAVDGVCLTAETFGADTFTVTAGRETLALTTAGDWRPGREVHLERALRVGDRLGGHLVQGHVDGVGRVASAEVARESLVVWVEAPPALRRYIASKGSICVDGISLTVNELRGDGGACFRINLIPHTALVTSVRAWQPGRRVNLEVDVIARYVERMLSAGPPAPGGENPPPGLTLERLARLGYGSRGER